MQRGELVLNLGPYEVEGEGSSVTGHLVSPHSVHRRK